MKTMRLIIPVAALLLLAGLAAAQSEEAQRAEADRQAALAETEAREAEVPRTLQDAAR